MYDEAKRFAEAMTMAYHRYHGLDVRIVRIFNTYGPRMRPDDGRVVSNFIVQALQGKPLTIYGDGSQTRSFCYVDDEIRGFLALLDADDTGPVNIGNPGEFTMLELAEHGARADRLVVGDRATSRCPVDDPTQRRPDITLARSALGLGAGGAAARGLAAHRSRVLPPAPERDSSRQASPVAWPARQWAGLGVGAVGQVPVERARGGPSSNGVVASKPNCSLGPDGVDARGAAGRRAWWRPSAPRPRTRRVGDELDQLADRHLVVGAEVHGSPPS